ncbi:BZ3500_MvSof-1268-A1-R1_Chr4-2g07145 [Microbotryum saponariae]|uniref:BZ3500_MvSof-1268-A1-R1_Chr4-2g07145 protein n=1 Tax=Microbotryum saponariae TaxID=289078 RepID=A0A2X0MYF5_9BASI|nr:BZ3500_MvSof-1268-A1-R1_Chr4-2g07145 [Microbotryum saponariae]
MRAVDTGTKDGADHKQAAAGDTGDFGQNDQPETASKPGWRSKVTYPLFAAPLDGTFRHPTFKGLVTTMKIPAERANRYCMLPLFPAPKPPGTHSLFVQNHNRARWRARKSLARGALVLLGAFILVLEPKSLTRLGNAAFFGCISAIMIPANLPVMMILLVGFLLVFGMCLGWAWSCAAMAAAARTRSQALLGSEVKSFRVANANAQNIDALYRVAIFQGQFLDWRSTLVIGVFFVIGSFALGLMRANAPKLMVASIFGTIVMDVMLSYGPLFPSANYTLAYNFLLPTGCFLGIAAAGSVLIFPESINSTWTTSLVDTCLTPVYERIALFSKLLRTPPPSSTSTAWIDQHDAWNNNAMAIASGVNALLGGMGTMELEASVGRMSAKDYYSLKPLLEELASRSLGLGSLYRGLESQALRTLRDTKGIIDLQAKLQHPIGREAPHLNQLRSNISAAEDKHAHSIATLLPRFANAVDPLLIAMDEALLGAMTWLSVANTSRWKRFRSDQVAADYEAQRERVAALERAMEEYRTTRRLEIFAPFQKFFDLETGRPRSELKFSPISLMQVLSASDALVGYATTILNLVARLSELENKRRVNKLWMPTGLRKIGKLAFSRHRSQIDGVTGDGDDPDQVVIPFSDSTSTLVDGAEKEEEELHFFLRQRNEEKKDPDVRAPRNAAQRFGGKLYGIGRWCKTTETIFAIKYVAIGLALWLPQVFKTSAYFTYVNKGLWALITAQTFLSLYAGDQIMATIQKIAGTVVGLLYGMMIWYVGNGRGSNRIGTAASLFVFMLPLLALRNHAPPAQQQMAILTAVTTVLIVGYSWVNGHLATLGGTIGAQLAWRRALLVIIGSVASMIIMLFPGHQSSRLLVRKTHATCIGEIGRIYMALLSHWIAEDRHDAQKHSSEELVQPRPEATSLEFDAFTPAVQKEAREILLATWAKLIGTTQHIKESRYELSLRGDWPAAEYKSLLRAQVIMMQALGSLGLGLVRLEPAWRKMLIRSTAFLHPNLISDVSSTFALLSLALREGAPLPQATPGPLLDRLLYHDKKFKTGRSEASDQVLHTADGARLGEFELTWTILRDERFGTYASTIVALGSLLLTLDDAETAVKALVGEVYMPGYDYLVERARQEL